MRHPPRPVGLSLIKFDGQVFSGAAAIQDSLARRARSSDKKMISTESAFQGKLERGFGNHTESGQRMIMAQWESGIKTRIQR